MSESKRILIIDNNKDFRSYIGQMLKENFSLLVSEVGSLLELQKVIPHQVYDLIFIDLNTPDVNGFHLSQKFADISPNSVVVMMAIDDSLEYHEASFSSGAMHFLSKGNFVYNDFIDFMNDFIDGKIFRKNTAQVISVH